MLKAEELIVNFMTQKLLRIFVFLIFAASVNAQTVSRSDCFPLEKLSSPERAKAEELLLKALDGEALFTIVGGLKPMSSGFASFQLQTRLPRQTDDEAEKIAQSFAGRKPEELSADEKPKFNAAKTTLERRDTLRKLEETRKILETWRCGDELFADVEHFSRAFEGKRFLDGVVFSRSSLRRMLAEKREFFSRWGLTESAQPLQVLYAVEYDETGARFGGYGFLFGYPDYAVRFFVEAADEEELTGKFVERGFYPIPTFAASTGDFVYAVPKNHVETEADKNLKARAAQILNEYKRRRAEYVGAGKRGVVEMLRDWFCDKQGNCAPDKAKIE